LPKNRVGAYLLPVVVMVVIVAVVGAVLFSALQKETRLLPDGSVLTLEAVTYGTRHRFIAGTWLQQLLHAVLPARHKQHSGCLVKVYDTGENKLVLWTTHLDPRKGTGAMGDSLDLFIEDEQGHEPSLCSSTREGLLAVRGIEYWEASVFPRRSQTLRLRFYRQGSRDLLAEFAVSNPTPGPFPTWTSEPLPATRHYGNVSLTLVSFTTGLDGPNNTEPARPGELIRGLIRYRLNENDRRARSWELQRVRLWDATGNTEEHYFPSETELEFFGALAAGETAWKMNFQIARDLDSAFTPQEYWIVRGLSIPNPNTVTHTTATATRLGVTLRLLGIAGPGNQSVWPAGWSSDELTIVVRASSLRDDFAVAVRAADERGRRLHTSTLTGGWEIATSRKQDYYFYVKAPPDAKSVSLRVLVSRAPKFEFLASPSSPSSGRKTEGSTSGKPPFIELPAGVAAATAK